jgi:hypothetical protein
MLLVPAVGSGDPITVGASQQEPTEPTEPTILPNFRPILENPAEF